VIAKEFLNIFIQMHWIYMFKVNGRELVCNNSSLKVRT
jgi:hypothetical protein